MSPIDPRQADTIVPGGPAGPGGTPLGTRYVLEEEIGRGATGRVWRGRRLADGAPLAFKVMHPQFTGDPQAVVRFLSQRTVLDRLYHPHLVPVHDLIADDLIAIVMDVVEGESLRALLTRQGLPPPEALIVLAQVASAIAAMHAAQIIHRDIKPENVMVARRDGLPHAMLTDLGLAKPLHSPRLTKTGELSGTPAYVAPEILSGRPAEPASDVYSLGIVAYELLAGRPPFQAETAVAMMRAHLEDEPPRPAGWGDALWKAVSACLAKDPAQRPSANTLRFLFQGLAGQPIDLAGQLPTIGASRPAPLQPVAPLKKRSMWYRWLAIGLACALLGAAAGVAWNAYRHRQTDPVKPPAPVAYPYFLPINVSSPEPGTIELAFADATGLPGFQSYLIFRDDLGALASVPPGNGVPPYRHTAPDQETAYCYRVAALLYTDRPPQSLDIAPVCKAANGKP